MSADLVAFERTSGHITATESNTGSVVAGCGEKARARIVVKDNDFKVVRAGTYELIIGPEAFRGTIPENGIIDHLFKPGPREGSLEVTNVDGTVDRWDFDIAAMDPLSMESGAAVRLRNLAMLPNEEAAKNGIDTLRDLYRLQWAEQYDSTTAELLERVYNAEDELPVEEARWIADETLPHADQGTPLTAELPVLEPVEE
jgi:hypothetical protein